MTYVSQPLSWATLESNSGLSCLEAAAKVVTIFIYFIYSAPVYLLICQGGPAGHSAEAAGQGAAGLQHCWAQGGCGAGGGLPWPRPRAEPAAGPGGGGGGGAPAGGCSRGPPGVCGRPARGRPRPAGPGRHRGIYLYWAADISIYIYNNNITRA